jgi:hypothetical protein
MCEKIIENIPTMTAAERVQLRQNCTRAADRSPDQLIVKEAKRVLDELDRLEYREMNFLAALPEARRIEYAFRRLPASDRERLAIRMLHEHDAIEPPASNIKHEEFEHRALQRHVGEMCRNRLHLLRPGEDPRSLASTPADAPDCVAPLLEIDDNGCPVRLKPEAVAAFSSLGYVAPRRS